MAETFKRCRGYSQKILTRFWNAFIEICCCVNLKIWEFWCSTFKIKVFCQKNLLNALKWKFLTVSPLIYSDIYSIAKLFKSGAQLGQTNIAQILEWPWTLNFVLWGTSWTELHKFCASRLLLFLVNLNLTQIKQVCTSQLFCLYQVFLIQLMKQFLSKFRTKPTILLYSLKPCPL